MILSDAVQHAKNDKKMQYHKIDSEGLVRF